MVLVEGIVITGGATIVIVLVFTNVVLHSAYPITDKVNTISPTPVGLIVGVNEFGLRMVAGPETTDQFILVKTEVS